MTKAKRKSPVLDHVKDDLTDDVYEVGPFLRDGTDGVVFTGHSLKQSPTDQLAIKFYFARSMLMSTRTQKELDDHYDNELEKLVGIIHPNLQFLKGHGYIEYDKPYFSDYQIAFYPPAKDAAPRKIHFIVSRMIRGQRLDDYIKNDLHTSSDLIHVLKGIASGLAYLHQRETLHRDLISENIVIESGTNNPVLIDFGLAKTFTPQGSEHHPFFIDPTRLPSEIAVMEMQLMEEQKWDYESRRRTLFPWADLYAFGLLLDEVLKSRCAHKLSSTDAIYLRLIADDLKRWNECDPLADGRRTTLSGDIRSSEALVERLNRLELGNQYYDHKFRSTEKSEPRTIVRSQGTLKIRDSVAPLLSMSKLRRLHNFHQLHLVHYIYPSASQTRFDHVLSTLSMCQQMWRALSADPAFLYYMDNKSIDRLEIAALVHDINHFPFLHYFQEAGISQVGKADVLRTFLPDDDELTSALEIRGINRQYLNDLMIVDDPMDLPHNMSISDQVIRSIINSGVDVDKLSYLIDDAAFTGVPFGRGVDIQGLLANITIGEVECNHGRGPRRVWHIVYPEDALPAVESVCLARYWNFRRIYWHHFNRAMAIMITWTIRKLFGEAKETVDAYLANTSEGEGAAINFLTSRFYTHYKINPPIADLATQRDRVYKRVFERGYDGSLFAALQHVVV